MQLRDTATFDPACKRLTLRNAVGAGDMEFLMLVLD